MTITTQIKCDHCASDLTDSGPRPSYMLTLSAARMPITSHSMPAVHVIPLIAHDHHFCDKTCLSQWLTKSKT